MLIRIAARMVIWHWYTTGIIENYAVLKEKLQAKGCTFKSSTDTEVLVQLIGYIQQQGNLDLLTAVQLALREVIRCLCHCSSRP